MFVTWSASGCAFCAALLFDENLIPRLAAGIRGAKTVPEIPLGAGWERALKRILENAKASGKDVPACSEHFETIQRWNNTREAAHGTTR